MLFAVFLLVLWFLNVALATDPCFRNTTDVFLYLSDVGHGEDETLIVLCPNTVFSIGNLGESEDEFLIEDGMMPLIAFPRVHYLCGTEGSSLNNCTIQGGDIQFWNPPEQHVTVERVTIEGITFQDSDFVAILLQGPSEVVFVDCVVRGHVQGAPVLIDYSPLRRNLGEHRDLQGFVQNVIFQESTFVQNEQRLPPALFTYGIISVWSPYNYVSVQNCTFTDNHYDEFFDSGSYAIRSFGARVDVEDSCFLDNSFVGFGPVQVFSYEDELTIVNNGGTSDPTLTCSFMALSEDTIPETEEQVTCVPFDNDECKGTDVARTNAPSFLPSSPPSLIDAPVSGKKHKEPTMSTSEGRGPGKAGGTMEKAGKATTVAPKKNKAPKESMSKSKGQLRRRMKMNGKGNPMKDTKGME